MARTSIPPRHGQVAVHMPPAHIGMSKSTFSPPQRLRSLHRIRPNGRPYPDTRAAHVRPVRQPAADAAARRQGPAAGAPGRRTRQPCLVVAVGLQRRTRGEAGPARGSDQRAAAIASGACHDRVREPDRQCPTHRRTPRCRYRAQRRRSTPGARRRLSAARTENRTASLRDHQYPGRGRSARRCARLRRTPGRQARAAAGRPALCRARTRRFELSAIQRGRSPARPAPGCARRAAPVCARRGRSRHRDSRRPVAAAGRRACA